jgi:hypothetical protein
VEAAQAAADRAEAAVRDKPEDADVDADLQQQQQQQEAEEAAAAAMPVARQLWADKYSPKSFLALLSEPRVNREIAAWMSRWTRQQQQATRPQHGRQQQQQPNQPQQQQQRPQQAGRGGGAADAGRGRGAGGRGGGSSSGGAGEGGRQGGIVRGFDAARYKALQEARAAARVLLVVGPPGEVPAAALATAAGAVASQHDQHSRTCRPGTLCCVCNCGVCGSDVTVSSNRSAG